jgi:hypothetical protein
LIPQIVSFRLRTSIYADAERGAGMSSTDASRLDAETGAANGPAAPKPGELIYEYTPRVVGTVEYGASSEALFAGETPPPEGGRLDLYLEGPVIDGKLRGDIRGVDYVKFRADGRADLHIHAEITTEDGKKVALEAGGVAIGQPGSSVLALREHASLTSHHPELAWVNAIEVWASGEVDVSTGQVHLKAYAG